MVLEFIVCVRGNNILLVSLKAVTSEGGKRVKILSQHVWSSVVSRKRHHHHQCCFDLQVRFVIFDFLKGALVSIGGGGCQTRGFFYSNRHYGADF